MRLKRRSRVTPSERHRCARKNLECVRIFVAQRRGGFKAVDQSRLTALDVVGDAVQQLHGRHRVAIRVVGVGRDRRAGEREVVRNGLDTDVKELAVVRLADKAK
jgi:hypothetical protein